MILFLLLKEPIKKRRRPYREERGAERDEEELSGLDVNGVWEG